MANEILKLLTLIINQSLETRIFPIAFKTSKGTPLYKKGDNTGLNNYGPISLLYLKCLSGSLMYNCITISVKKKFTMQATVRVPVKTFYGTRH